MDAEEKKLWQRYSATREDVDRNALIERYVQLAKYAAGKKFQSCPSSIQFEELLSAAYEGLMAGVKSFDLCKGFKPTTYLSVRIRWAMADYLRSFDPMSRLERGRLRKIEQHQNKLDHSLTPEEMLSTFGWTVREFELISLESEVLESEKSLRDIVADRNIVADQSAAHLNDLSWLLPGLGQRDRLILLLYYVEGLTMREIGQCVGISEARVSQLIPQLLTRMRHRVQAA